MLSTPAYFWTILYPSLSFLRVHNYIMLGLNKKCIDLYKISSTWIYEIWIVTKIEKVTFYIVKRFWKLNREKVFKNFLMK